MNLSYINNLITDNIAHGNYNVEVDMSIYDNSSGQIEIVIIPKELKKIAFYSNDPQKEYYFRIVAYDERIEDLEIILDNVYMNCGNNIGIDLRGVLNQSYKNVVSYSGVNHVFSVDSIGILVTNNMSMYINGTEETSMLIIKGGIENCAIGNSSIFNLGGNIIFDGEGIIQCFGGNGSLPSSFSYTRIINGGFGLGFAENTVGQSSITIKCNAKIEAYGGDGQNCDSDNPNSSGCGNGGAGISLGANGILLIQNCQSAVSSLVSYGGNGGEILGEGNVQVVRSSGNGGDAIAAVSGTIDIMGSAILQGGNGTSLNSLVDTFSIAGGNGGSAVSFSQYPNQSNDLILFGNIKMYGGNGGNGGTLLMIDPDLALKSMNGGNGGTVIEAGNSHMRLVVGENVELSSGNGGDGGSPKVYGSDIIGVPGSDSPGAGGSNGSIIHGTGKANLSISPDAIFINGVPGSGGTGLDESGNDIQGIAGPVLNPIDIDTGKDINFGYVNLKTVLSIRHYDSIPFRESLNQVMLCGNRKVSISQGFENCLRIDEICFKQHYTMQEPYEISANVLFIMIVNSSVNVFEKAVIPVITKL